MAVVLGVINFHERDNTERQRLPRVFNCHPPWEDFSFEELLKRYRFGGESLLFIAWLIDGEVRPLTRRNQAHHLRLIILAVVMFGGLAAGRQPVFLWDCIIPEFVGFFCQFGPCFAIFPNFDWCRFFIAVNLGRNSFPQLLLFGICYFARKLAP